MNFKAFIFDFDNTIIYSNEDHVKSFIKVGKKIGRKIPANEIRKRFGMSAFEILEDLFPKKSRGEILRLRTEKERIYRRIIAKKKVRTIGGIRELLKFLKKNKIKIAIVSSASVENIKIGLKMNKLAKYFHVKIGAENVKKHKPNPEPLLKAMKKLRMKPKDCIYIGDSIYDMIAARRADMRRLGLTTGFYNSRKMKKNGAMMTFKNHTEVLRTLKYGRI